MLVPALDEFDGRVFGIHREKFEDDRSTDADPITADEGIPVAVRYNMEVHLSKFRAGVSEIDRYAGGFTRRTTSTPGIDLIQSGLSAPILPLVAPKTPGDEVSGTNSASVDAVSEMPRFQSCESVQEIHGR